MKQQRENNVFEQEVQGLKVGLSLRFLETLFQPYLYSSSNHWLQPQFQPLLYPQALILHGLSPVPSKLVVRPGELKNGGAWYFR